jgi:hypothetical protein
MQGFFVNHFRRRRLIDLWSVSYVRVNRSAFCPPTRRGARSKNFH